MKIAIIGAGAAGTLVAMHLMRQPLPARPVEIIMFERRAAQYLRGIAFSSLRPEPLLNVASAQMSLLPDQPNHFVNWLAGTSGQENGFCSRQLYGLYLEETFQSSMQESGARIGYRSVLSPVVQLQKNADSQWTVITKAGRAEVFAKVILAIGNLPPQTPAEISSRAAEHPRYFAQPWNLPSTQWFRDSSILIMGTGLSSVDVVLELAALNHRGRVVMFSRKGLLPQPHAQGQPCILEVEGLSKLTSLRQRLAFIRESVVVHDGVWQDVMAALRPHTVELWQSLSLAERRRFLRHLKTYWETHRHRAPAHQLRRLRQLDNVEVRKARLLDLDHNGADFIAKWPGESENFDIVINATGPSHDYRTDKYKLFKNFGDYVLPDPLGLGLRVNEDLNVIGSEGVQPGLFAIGSLTKGQFWEVTAIPDIRRQAVKIAAQILREGA